MVGLLASNERVADGRPSSALHMPALRRGPGPWHAAVGPGASEVRELPTTGKFLLGGILVLALGLVGACVVLRHERRPPRIKLSSDMYAKGRLRLVGPAITERAGRDHPLDQLVPSEEFALVSPVLEYWVPHVLVRHVPPAGPATPDLPSAPEYLVPPEDDDDPWGPLSTVAGGQLAAAVYGRLWHEAPSILSIAHGRRGRAAVVKTTLLESVSLDQAWLVILDEGQGLLVHLDGSRDISQGLAGAYSCAYIARAPEWQPRLLVDSERQGGIPAISSPAGRTVDGDTVYILGIHPSETGGQCPRSLWAIDTRNETVRRICAPAELADGAIPSPDATLLASVHGVWRGIEPELRAPLRIIDSRSGSIHDVTWHAPPAYYTDSALA